MTLREPDREKSSQLREFLAKKRVNNLVSNPEDDIFTALYSYEVANRKAEELGESAKITPVLVGKQGVGKSAIIREYAKLTGSGLVIIEMGQMNEIDFMGVLTFMNSMRDISEEEASEILKSRSASFHGHTVPEWIYRTIEMIEKHGKVVIMFDEINRARPAVMNALMNFFLTGEFGSDKLKLPRDRVFTIAAMNPDDGEFSVNELDPAIENRFIFLNIDVSLERLLTKYGENLHPIVVDFLIKRPDLIYKIDKNNPIQQLTARKWDMISQMLKAADVMKDYSIAVESLKDLFPSIVDYHEFSNFVYSNSKSKTVSYKSLERLVDQNSSLDPDLELIEVGRVQKFLLDAREMGYEVKTLDFNNKNSSPVVDYTIVSTAAISEEQFINSIVSHEKKKLLEEKKKEDPNTSLTIKDITIDPESIPRVREFYRLKNFIERETGVKDSYVDLRSIASSVNVKNIRKDINRYILNSDERFFQMLELFRLSRTVPFIQGPAGIGKTQKVEAYAKKIDAELIKLELSNIDPVDFYGYLKVIEKIKGEDIEVDRIMDLLSEFKGEKVDTISIHTNSVPSWVLQVVKATKEGRQAILYLDEFNRAKPDVLNSAMNLILEGNIGQYKLPENCMIILSGNPPEEYDTESLDPAQADRLIPINMEPNLNDWVKFAKRTGIHQVVIDYLLEKSGDFFRKRNRENEPDINPRRWSMVSYLIHSVEEIVKERLEQLVERYQSDIPEREIELLKENSLKNINKRLIELLGIEVGGRISAIYERNYFEKFFNELLGRKVEFMGTNLESFVNIISRKQKELEAEGLSHEEVIERLKNDKTLKKAINRLESIRALDIADTLLTELVIGGVKEEIVATFLNYVKKEDISRNILFGNSYYINITLDSMKKELVFDENMSFDDVIEKLNSSIGFDKMSLEEKRQFLLNSNELREFLNNKLLTYLDDKYRLNITDELIRNIASLDISDLID